MDKSLSEAITTLSDTINKNADDIVERIRKKRQAEQLADGTKTQKEAFAEDVKFAEGEMVVCFCPSCGRKIKLHEKMTMGYCFVCGDKVNFKDAKYGNFSKDAITHMEAEDLFEVATLTNIKNKDLLIEAAKKKHVVANRMVGYDYVLSNDYEKALPYLEFAKENNDIDGSFLYIIVMLMLNEIHYDTETREKVKKINKSAFAIPELSVFYDKTLKVIDEQIKAESDARKYNSHSSNDSIISKAAYDVYNGNSSGLSPSAKKFCATDYRTGEQLYNDNGKIVDKNGKEVAASWWD